MSRFTQRRAKLHRKLKQAGADALLVTNFKNVTYLTGFTGDDSYLIEASSQSLLISDPRYETQLAEECPGLEVHLRGPGEGMSAAVATTIGLLKPQHLAIEAGSMTVALYETIAKTTKSVSLVSTTGLVETLREIKDQDEIKSIRQAIDFAERAFAVVRESLVADQTEKQVADEIEYQMRRFGARGASFEPIVAVGSNAALPHAHPTGRRIGDSPLLLIDWGASGPLYKSDLTRTLATDKISTKLERVYRVVLTAQAAAIAAIRPGASAHEVDTVARNVIAKAGFGRHFGHSLGHGIGLDIHEGPRLAQNQHRPLKAGMVITVEPGIYLPGWGGVRIEDDVLVTRTGHQVLSHVGKDLDKMLVRR